jgi:hypothetical protein
MEKVIPLNENIFQILKNDSILKMLLFWTKVHKLLDFNNPSLKTGVMQRSDLMGFSPKG